RRGLTRIGQSPLFKMFLKEERLVEDVVKAVVEMSRAKTGALIAIERQVTLKPYAESGTPLDAILSSELLLAIFMPNAPFHDGGTIIEGGRVAAASCLFPLSQSQSLSKALGTRHRAALGLSEETDAFVVVVSEETGTISVMNGGKIVRGVDEDGLRGHLAELQQSQKNARAAKKLAVAGKVS
ncbi:MAG TPA: DNA integrity scanning protein DisA nucleotide-binding domain protein, partial [Candidatus Eisenbacteria bacterium]|nr:DNA integrity scanning protein DisA nucleotide-binding domain protein [Candidatus Eisenbacteria bacterium]